MRIIVSDSSCLIDLRKASFAFALTELALRNYYPRHSVRRRTPEIHQSEKKSLLNGGMRVTRLPGNAVLRAQETQTRFPALSIHDCFAFALAERNPGCILLTGDGWMRSIATEHNIGVHGILWAIDEMHKAETISIAELLAASELFENDVTVRLPLRELRAYIKRFTKLSNR